MGRGLRAPLAVATVVVLLDQLTKHWALGALADGHVIDLVGSLRFNLAFNKGMAFSQGEGLGPIIGVVALVVIVVLLVSIGRSTSRWYPLAVGLIIGGALGNVSDRLFRGDRWLRGGVVDFIDLQWWPIFNVADIGVTVGGALLLLTSLSAPSEPASGPAGGSARAEVEGATSLEDHGAADDPAPCDDAPDQDADHGAPDHDGPDRSESRPADEERAER